MKKIKKGDSVIVLAGKDKGKAGKVLKIISDKNRALVQGVNMVKKHTKPSQTNKGGIESIEMPIQISNIAFQDPKTNTASTSFLRNSNSDFIDFLASLPT